jgi:hypothetical protein
MPIGRKPTTSSTRDQSAEAKREEAFLRGGGTLTATDQNEDENGDRQRVTLRLDPDLLKRIDRAAKRAHLKRNAWIQYKLATLLDDEEGQA